MGAKNAIAQILFQIRSIKTSPAESCLKFTKSKYYIFFINSQQTIHFSSFRYAVVMS